MKFVCCLVAAFLPAVAQGAMSKAPRDYEAEKARRELVYIDPETHVEPSSTASGLRGPAAVFPAGTCGNGIKESDEECDSGPKDEKGLRGNGGQYDPCDETCNYAKDPKACPNPHVRELRLYISTDQHSPDVNGFFMTKEDGSGNDPWVVPVGYLEPNQYYLYTACVDKRFCHVLDFFDLLTVDSSSRDFDVTFISDGARLTGMSTKDGGIDMSFFKRKQIGTGCAALPENSGTF